MSATENLPIIQTLDTAVLFLVFNRPDTTRQVFEAIRQAKPPRLYVAADGPRPDRLGEAEVVAEVREIIKHVDWGCEVKTLFRNDNLGCRKAVSQAITWFFENEECGIVLEDDCLPHPEFFSYCQELLQRYANDERVWGITGNNFQNGMVRGSGSYYFSKYFHCWGWASWRRAWRNYDVSLSYWPEWSRSADWIENAPDSVERAFWKNIFNKTHEGQINTWDYQWTACIWRYAGLVATPNVNLVSNIGFGTGATHTISDASQFAEMEVQGLGSMTHPVNVERDVLADRYTFDYHLEGARLRFPYNLLRLPLRAMNYVKRRVLRAG
ncbi:glycosyltransferase [Ectopseudomonas mendocina]|uniref:Hemolytic protein HlpA-like protein n=1 Tax=Ectopseudomonas mendocina TaxID=300 RepID=A0A2R3QTW4_ECTME|nr:glycosyltransferase [Pseudomonas mendocina]AVO55239.1 hemolytic protein HlpA-like protein [Pseudomonas mendocina]